MIVMKFGGTSVGSAGAIRRVGEIVRGRLDQKPVVVVSAVSGVTNRLIAAAEGAQKRKTVPETPIKEITRIHRDILAELDLPPDLVDPSLQRMSEVLRGIYFLRELTKRSMDYVMSFGELMSSHIVAAHFNKVGMSARPWAGWDVGFVTDSNYGEADVLPESYPKIRQKLAAEVEAGSVPVVTGFVGRNKERERTTLGRGGSDYSAAIVGKAIGALEIQIWTDVSGILSADPKIVPEAFTLRQVTFEEASELAYFGAKVLHPKTIEPAVVASIPVRILNTFSPEDPGTLVVAQSDRPAERTVKGLAVKKGNTLVNVTSSRMLDAEGYMAELFLCFRRHGVCVDSIATSEVSVSLTVDARYREALDRALVELGKVATIRVYPERAIVCVVGEGMDFKPGVAGRIFSVMGAAGVNIDMISQGSSELNVTFVVEDKDADRALRALHAEFLAPKAPA